MSDLFNFYRIGGHWRSHGKPGVVEVLRVLSGWVVLKSGREVESHGHYDRARDLARSLGMELPAIWPKDKDILRSSTARLANESA